MKICCFPPCLLKAEVLILPWAKNLGWCTVISDELLILLLLTPWGMRNPGPATCAFGNSKKILERDLPETRNKSSEIHFIFLSQMRKWEFRKDWKHYTLLYPIVACRDIPTLMKCKFHATGVHEHLNQDPTWYVHSTCIGGWLMNKDWYHHQGTLMNLCH